MRQPNHLLLLIAILLLHASSIAFSQQPEPLNLKEINFKKVNERQFLEYHPRKAGKICWFCWLFLASSFSNNGEDGNPGLSLEIKIASFPVGDSSLL